MRTAYPFPDDRAGGATDRAVSPVVGVALLIAITVVLAATIGAAVMSLGVGGAGVPEATLSFTADETAEEIVLIHEGGDPLDADEIVILDQDGNVVGELERDMTAGERLVIVDDDDYDVEEVRVVWEDPDTDNAQILANFRP